MNEVYVTIKVNLKVIETLNLPCRPMVGDVIVGRERYRVESVTLVPNTVMVEVTRL